MALKELKVGDRFRRPTEDQKQYFLQRLMQVIAPEHQALVSKVMLAFWDHRMSDLKEALVAAEAGIQPISGRDRQSMEQVLAFFSKVIAENTH